MAFILGHRWLRSKIFDALREERGWAYDVQCHYHHDRVFQDGSVVLFSAQCAPEVVEPGASVARAVIQEALETGPIADELEPGRQMSLRGIKRVHESTGYWGRVLANLHTHGRSLEDLARFPSCVRTLRADDLVSIVRTQLVEARHVEVQLYPQEPTEEESISRTRRPTQEE